MEKQYKVMAGEGEQLYVHGYYKTVRGARNAARRASCRGDRHSIILQDSGMVDKLSGQTHYEIVERIS